MFGQPFCFVGSLTFLFAQNKFVISFDAGLIANYLKIIYQTTVFCTFQREICTDFMAVKLFKCRPDGMGRIDLDLQGFMEVVRMILTKAQVVMYRHVTSHLHIGLLTDICVEFIELSDDFL